MYINDTLKGRNLTMIVKLNETPSLLIKSFFLFCISSGIAYAEVGAGAHLQDISLNSMVNTGQQQRVINQLYSQKRYKESIDQIDVLLKTKPNDIELLMKKAGIYADMENYKEAIPILDKVIALDP